MNNRAPRGIINQTRGNNVENQSLVTSQNISGDTEKAHLTIKIPVAIKISIFLGIIVASLVPCLAIFVVLFGDPDAHKTSTGTVGTYMYGGSCTTINVVDTGCDSLAQHCTNQYSGQVELDTYVAGVVAAKAGTANNTEYYKTAAIIARTHVQKNITSSCTVQGNSNFQEYININDPNHEYIQYVDKIKTAVADTTNMVMVKEGTLIDVKPSEIGSDWNINQEEALGLINNQSYSYEKVLKHYYGSDIQLTNNTVTLTGVNGFLNPLSKIICNSAFGYREFHPVTGEPNKFHGGIDLGTNLQNIPIYAAKSGTVVTVYKHVTLENDGRTDENGNGISDWDNGGGYGNYIIIDHGDGTKTLYAHIKHGTIPDSIDIGATVTQGQQIGVTGTTGRSSGIHLHYEVRVNGTKKDPADYLDLTNASKIEECRR